MFGRLKKHRRYQYTPRIYKPEEEARKKRKIRFRRSLAPKKNYRKLLLPLGIIIIVIYISYLLSQKGY